MEIILHTVIFTSLHGTSLFLSLSNLLVFLGRKADANSSYLLHRLMFSAIAGYHSTRIANFFTILGLLNGLYVDYLEAYTHFYMITLVFGEAAIITGTSFLYTVYLRIFHNNDVTEKKLRPLCIALVVINTIINASIYLSVIPDYYRCEAYENINALIIYGAFFLLIMAMLVAIARELSITVSMSRSRQDNDGTANPSRVQSTGTRMLFGCFGAALVSLSFIVNCALNPEAFRMTSLFTIRTRSEYTGHYLKFDVSAFDTFVTSLLGTFVSVPFLSLSLREGIAIVNAKTIGRIRSPSLAQAVV